MIAHATTQADIIIEDAKEESKLIRGEASTFVLNQKAEATNQIELERAQAQKSLDEMRLILATQAAPKVISQKIMALLSENAENSAQNTKRAEEIEARHREAVLNTDNYISSVQIQLSTAKTRLREVEEEVSQRTAELKKELENLRLSAHKEAEAMIAAAEKQSRQKMADSDKYVAAVLKTIYEHIASLKLERESLIQYFDALQLELEKTLKTTTAGTSPS
jgi:F0F1-type ATP synthase membrane subunit b/b'